MNDVRKTVMAQDGHGAGKMRWEEGRGGRSVRRAAGWWTRGAWGVPRVAMTDAARPQ